MLRHRYSLLLAGLLAAGLYLATASLQGKPNRNDSPPAPSLDTLSAAAEKALEVASAEFSPTDGPEPQLAKIFALIEQNRLDDALLQCEALLRHFPNFRLAHLIKGDLLLARARPLQDFGAASGAPREKVADLREEALARLKAYRGKPPANFVPRYLLQMRPDQEHAFVIDTSKARLYIYANDNGTPRFVADYYISHGKLGADKYAEGDKRTPLGVYHVTSRLPREKLTDFYGHGAYPINYPNDLDRQQGRNGHGIWLHGTPSDTFSRPPKASDGCVVLTNSDFDRIGQHVQVGVTPVIISNHVEWLSPDDWNKERAELRQLLENWRQDWESRDVERFLRHYSPHFAAGKQNFSQFAAQKRQVNEGKQWIKVDIDRLTLFRNPGQDDMIVATFEQKYRSNNLENTMQKRLYWKRENGQWKIIYEGAA